MKISETEMIKLLEEITKGTTADCNESEDLLVSILLAHIAMNINGPTKIKARVFSILSQYYGIIEGLEK